MAHLLTPTPPAQPLRFDVITKRGRPVAAVADAPLNPADLTPRRKPLLTHQVIVNLIAATTTKTGLKVNAAIDSNRYPTGRKITDAEMATLNITRDDFHGDSNYTLHPTP